MDMTGPAAEGGGGSIIREMLLWEKAVWIAIAIFLLIVLAVFWLLGWSQLPFPV